MGSFARATYRLENETKLKSIAAQAQHFGACVSKLVQAISG